MELSLPEIFAALLSLIAVILTVRLSIWSWPVWIAATLIYAWVFFQAKLYADTLLQGIFLILEVKGWVDWSKKDKQQKIVLSVSRSDSQSLGLHALLVLVFAGLSGFLLSRFTDAALPYLDSFTAALSISATLLQTRKKIENWLILFFANLIYIGMYLNKSLYLTAGLYLVFLSMAASGFFAWRKEMRKQSQGISEYQAPN